MQLKDIIDQAWDALTPKQRAEYLRDDADRRAQIAAALDLCEVAS
jgi:hypothetical protein